MIHSIALVTDSTCDLPPELLAEHGITVIPQKVVWNGVIYRDGVDLSAADFYHLLPSARDLPTTLPPSPAEFAHTFEQARAAAEADRVVALLLSSKLSQSFIHAQTAARELDFPVSVLDTQTVSLGLGLTVLAAAEARDRGARVEQILDVVRQTRRQTRLYFTVDTLDFLYRSGRIGGARHLIGQALSIKPILTMVGGQVEVVENVRTRPRAVLRMLELAANDLTNSAMRVGVTHGNAPEEAQALLDYVHQTWQPHQLVSGVTCPALGAHIGPGVLSIAVSTV
jgi:DegV family protein with EDD domain